ncbi:MAG: hypothetical protein KKG67_21065 [Gammaproteobacteria bacterium]|nr:hypothetical protein [Gammaproteobacteria bacterium]
MTTFQTLLDSKKSSETFSVDPKQLGLSEREFSRLASGWVAAGGGPGFRVVRPHRESQTSESLYDIMLLEKL